MKLKMRFKKWSWKWDLKNFLGDVVYMYVKTRTCWLVSSEMDDHKLFFWKSKTRSHIILLKKICNTAESSWNLLINIQKQLFD